MVPYSQICSRLIKPYNFYTYTPESKQHFLAKFEGDVMSFLFLHDLIRYVTSKAEYSGEWPDIITLRMLDFMSKEARQKINLEDTQVYKNGYIIKNGQNYELTHEFIVTSFLSCSDGNFLPLSTGHIDFTNEEKIRKYLQNEIIGNDPETVLFLWKILLEMQKKPGILMGQPYEIFKAKALAQENNLNYKNCISTAQNFNLIFPDDNNDVLICNALFFIAYLASPKLN